MKRLLLVITPLLFLLAACTRQDVSPRPPIDESYWLTQERGIVTYSSFDCDFFIIETYDGFSVVRSWGGAPPLRGSVIYGNLSQYGVRTMYNRTEGYLMQADIREYWLTYWDAIDQVDWNCSRP
jgi:hypothetical protein